MKKLLLIALIALVPLLQARSDYRDGYRDGSHPIRSKSRFVPVVKSEPIYEEVVTYRRCRVHGSAYPEAYHHQGALIGGLIGGIIGHNLDTHNRGPATVGGAVAGAIIGSHIARNRHSDITQCRHIETQIVGYRNIAYWHGGKIVEISERPLHRIRICDRHCP